MVSLNAEILKDVVVQLHIVVLKVPNARMDYHFPSFNHAVWLILVFFHLINQQNCRLIQSLYAYGNLPPTIIIFVIFAYHFIHTCRILRCKDVNDEK